MTSRTDKVAVTRQFTSQNLGAKVFRYDPAGNLEFVMFAPGGSQYREDRFSYYDADGHLRAADFRSRVGGLGDNAKWVFDTYRYDAFGRRVWVRSDRKCSAISGGFTAEWMECDLSTVRRTVWDGDRELVELQVPVKQAGSTTEESASTLENDRYVPDLPQAQGNDQNPFFGRVVYTHGLGTDQPIGLTRYNYVDRFGTAPSVVAFPPTALSLVWNTLGKLSFDDGDADA